MARLSATISIRTLVVICGLAAMPAALLAQSTGGSAGSTGVANSPAPPPGTNSLGTAQSSGANTAPGISTGTGAGTSADAAVDAENRLLEKKMKGICRGC